jgi:hypothetical protein
MSAEASWFQRRGSRGLWGFVIILWLCWSFLHEGVHHVGVYEENRLRLLPLAGIVLAFALMGVFRFLGWRFSWYPFASLRERQDFVGLILRIVWSAMEFSLYWLVIVLATGMDTTSTVGFVKAYWWCLLILAVPFQEVWSYFRKGSGWLD